MFDFMAKLLWQNCAGPQLYHVNFSFQDYLYKFGYMSPTSRSANNDVKTGIKKVPARFCSPSDRKTRRSDH